jgi:hypothetical protein
LEALKGGFRRACVKRLVGDENGAIDVLKNEIPLLVVAWAKTSSLEPAEKKGKLKEMFDDESARAEELAVAFDLFAARFEARVASRVNDSVSGMVKKFEKISSKLETLLSQLGSTQLPLPQEPEAIEELPIEEEVGISSEDENKEEVISPQQDVESDLDPPVGTGLKFDEIEEMIDKLLSSE